MLSYQHTKHTALYILSVTVFFYNRPLVATLKAKQAYENADYIIIATPTNYDEKTKYFDTKSIENVIDIVRMYNQKGVIVIKSTIPIGYMNRLTNNIDTGKILFAPEFLREGKALFDCLNPSRIIVGGEKDEASKFIKIILSCCDKKDVPTLLTNYTEAEAIKLFANSFLAMRVAFFNEIDTYAEVNEINSGDIIRGVCLDPRIGDYYNNPSLGYGGYCLPKDTKQLLTNFSNIPSNIVEAIVKANEKKFR